MVHAFIIHTLGARPGEEPGGCRVLYSRVFGAEASLDDPRPHSPERDRLGRKEQILAVARQVETAHRLLLQATGRPALDLLLQSPDEPVSLQDAPSGVFRLRPGDPFQESRVVLWLGVLSLGFVLVCEPPENLRLAKSTLRLLARLLLDHLRLFSSGSDVLLKADRTEAVLDKLLPQGQLLFLNDQFIQVLEKELGAGWAR
ncbi:AP-5 complex subunit sigma-1 [Ornithorhynchus anatinus]|uniref:Adaptor related protein complex 5 subunit sigma 1 n=1 Tax=Ornithorhynchus anatinus TaxID=9258 RepID=A0A6I8P0A7_ORNAN|nr:AP-5 complex subunit sigma-1 [Ornithorhynchus anatinus]XP_028939030.1 AP-5 complex subunit sigma-1 [Ornithorhynchus anatinus]